MMGSPLSPIIADVVRFRDLDLESYTLEKLGLHLPFYVQYVDNIALAAAADQITDISNTFNIYHNRL